MRSILSGRGVDRMRLWGLNPAASQAGGKEGWK